MREALPGEVAAGGVEGDLRGAVRQFLQLDQAVQRRNVGDGQARQVGFAVGAVGAMPAGVAGGEEVAGRPGEEEVVRRVAAGLDEVGAAFQQGQVVRDGVRVAADEEQFGLHHDARGGELHAPIVNGDAAIALLIDDPAGPGGIAEAAVGADPVHGRLGADAVAVAHLVEPQILGVLEKGDKRLAQQRQDAVGGAVGVLYPPRAPGGAFHEAVPLGLVEHGQVLQFGVGLEHAAGCVEQPQVFDVAAATVVLAVELRRGRAGGGRGCGARRERPGRWRGRGGAVSILLTGGWQALAQAFEVGLDAFEVVVRAGGIGVVQKLVQAAEIAVQFHADKLLPERRRLLHQVRRRW